MKATKQSKQRYILIFILFFHAVNTFMDRACISAAKTPIMEDLGIDDQMIGYIFGIFALGYAMFQIPGGWIADNLGPKKALTIVVSVWSAFTALTGAAFNAASMLVLRFLFGAGEAGAYPGSARAFVKWTPPKERGLATGINHSGSRVGAAIALFIMPGLIQWIGWRWTFVVNGLIGLIWVTIWLIWFKNDPKDNKNVNQAELDYINNEVEESRTIKHNLSFGKILVSSNMILLMIQYFASNATFFVSFSWFLPYLEKMWGSGSVYYAAIPLAVGAFSNWTAAGLTTILYDKGFHVNSRRMVAIAGFALGIIGLLLSTQAETPLALTIFFSIAIFGVDLTLSPSWAFCMDIGGEKTGTVSASMNMVGNLGSAISAIIFPFFMYKVTIPFFANETGTANSFFIFAAFLNLIAIACWMFLNPKKMPTKEMAPTTQKILIGIIISSLIIVTCGVVLLTILIK